MEKRLSSTLMLAILKEFTASSLDPASCGVIEIHNFELAEAQLRHWFIAPNSDDNLYTVYRADGEETTFSNAMSGYYFYSYDEPISDLIPTYKLVECNTSGEILSTVYEIGRASCRERV